MLSAILVALLVGLVVGALARLVVPGRQPIGLLMTILIGVLGSVAGSFLGRALHLGAGVTVIIDVAVAAVLVYAIAGGRRRPALRR